MLDLKGLPRAEQEASESICFLVSQVSEPVQPLTAEDPDNLARAKRSKDNTFYGVGLPSGAAMEKDRRLATRLSGEGRR